MYIKSVKFESNNSSYPKLLVLGAIHGNETCGSNAIKDIIDDINSDKIKLKQGSVTFIEKSNPKAYEENKRYHETNLNRVIKKTENPILYEEKLGNILTAHIDECEYMLDLHSMPENGTPFAFQDYFDEKNEEFAKIQGLDYVFQGWPEIYKDCAIKDFSTQAYCCGEKNKIGTTVECGRHNDPESIKVAKNCILNTLSYLNMIEKTSQDIKQPKTIKMSKVFIKEKDGVINNFNHLDLIHKNDVIAKYNDGENIVADDEYVMILPNNTGNIKEEWFYLGKEVK